MLPPEGDPAVHTGAGVSSWKGHLVGVDHVVAGNLLESGATVEAMSAGFCGAEGTSLAERLLAALLDGVRAGGDRRGTRSAALTVATTGPYPYLDLRVDDHDLPVDELRRIHDLAVDQLIPFIDGLPTRADPGGAVDRGQPSVGSHRPPGPSCSTN